MLTRTRSLYKTVKRGKNLASSRTVSDPLFFLFPFFFLLENHKNTLLGVGILSSPLILSGFSGLCEWKRLKWLHKVSKFMVYRGYYFILSN